MEATRTDHAPIAGLLKILSAVLIAKVTLGVIWNNRFYFPPDFQSEFLIGRRHYFYEYYQYAFFSHVICGPISLLLGLALVSARLRIRWPAAHRWIGRIQVVNVAVVVAPGGFVMALRAAGGPIAVWGFAVLAILTAVTVVMGYVTVRQRNFVAHERWMFRCFLLLVSAVVLRLIAGLSIVAGIDSDWTYPVSAWASWLVPVGWCQWRFTKLFGDCCCGEKSNILGHAIFNHGLTAELTEEHSGRCGLGSVFICYLCGLTAFAMR